MADTLATMFPGRSQAELQAALDANAGSLEGAVEYLLHPPSPTPAQEASSERDAGLGDQPTIVYETGNAIADRARARQLEQDEIMARALALEDEQAAARSPVAAMRDFAGGLMGGGAGGASSRNAPASGGAGGTGVTLPTMEEIGSAVAPVVSGIQSAGRTAVEVVSGLYEELVGSATGGGAGRSGYSGVDAQQQQVLAARRRAAEADRAATSVVRGDGASPRRPGLQQRRTGLVDGAGGSSVEKKRE